MANEHLTDSLDFLKFYPDLLYSQRPSFPAEKEIFRVKKWLNLG